MAEGVLIIDKPAGPTSHDVVARVRRLCSTKRVGHAGTLDPAATGVLVVLLGVATRLAEYATELPKQYDAVIQFGLRTDSQDTTGATLSRDDTSTLTLETVAAALDRFRGEIWQTPPMVSAVKVVGKRLYELARRGETVERAARLVTIYSLRLHEFHPGPSASGRLHVECSSGTYVRTLCADLGETLGCGAAMGTLRRTRIGPFCVQEALSLEALEQAVNDGRLCEVLLPPDAAVAHLPVVRVGTEEQRRLLHGMKVSGQWSMGSSPGPGDADRTNSTSVSAKPPECGLQSASLGPRGSSDSGLKSALRPVLHPEVASNPADAARTVGMTVRVLDDADELIAIGRWEPEAGQKAGRGVVAPVKVLAENPGR